jgi:hypothetical protein
MSRRGPSAGHQRYDALALIPTDRAAFSYQPNVLKFVRRGAATRFLFDAFLGRDRMDLLSILRDTLRFKFVSLRRKTPFSVAALRHKIN